MTYSFKKALKSCGNDKRLQRQSILWFLLSSFRSKPITNVFTNNGPTLATGTQVQNFLVFKFIPKCFYPSFSIDPRNEKEK